MSYWLKVLRGMVVCSIVASAVVAESATNLYKPLAPSSFTGTNLNKPGNYGYKFTPHRSLTVSRLGGAFYGTHTVVIYNTATSSVVAAASVAGSGTSYVYLPITPVTLTAGVSYTLAVYFSGSGENYYYGGGVHLLPFNNNNDATIDAGCHDAGSLMANPCSTTTTLDDVYGVPDIQYTGGSTLGCEQITGPGLYTVTTNLVATGTGAASNCIYAHGFSGPPYSKIDCGGFSVTGGPDATNGRAIYVQSATDIDIVNCSLESGYPGSGGAFPLYIVSSTAISLSGSNVGSVAQNTTAVRVDSSTSVTVSRNTLFGEVQVNGSTLTTIARNAISCSPGHTQAGAIEFGTGNHNTATGNMIYGNWNGSTTVGCDDGIIPGTEDYDVFSDNHVTNVWDMGFESAGSLRYSTVSDNIFTYVTAAYGGGYGMGGWHSLSLDGNTYSGNVVDHSSGLFKFYPDTPYLPTFSFTNNVFKNNTLTNNAVGVYDFVYGPSVTSADAGGVSVTETNNTFTGNNWGPGVCSPEFWRAIPTGNVVDGGGNVCNGSCTYANTYPGGALSCGATTTCGGWRYDAGGGLGCWYTGTAGQTCNSVCSTHGGFNATTSTHTGNRAGTHFQPLDTDGGNPASVECSTNDTKINYGSDGTAPNQYYSVANCQLSCSCNN